MREDVYDHTILEGGLLQASRERGNDKRMFQSEGLGRNNGTIRKTRMKGGLNYAMGINKTKLDGKVKEDGVQDTGEHENRKPQNQARDTQEDGARLKEQPRPNGKAGSRPAQEEGRAKHGTGRGRG
jgi:hypothetical protein